MIVVYVMETMKTKIIVVFVMEIMKQTQLETVLMIRHYVLMEVNQMIVVHVMVQ